MRILFDQGTPAPLRRALAEHDVFTAYELNWSQLNNGALLEAAEKEGFAVMITTDTNLKYQQNLSGRSISIVVLTTTSWPRIRNALGSVVSAVAAVNPGS